jgi:branched-chain amino acid transport system permease protein
MTALRQTLRENWLYILIVIGLIIMPHAIGWATGSSPFGTPRGQRMIMSGPAVFWMSVGIKIFALSIFVMSYNLMFGFTGVISFGHAMFFGLGGYIIGLMLQYTELDANLALLLAVLIVLAVCGVAGFLIGLVSLRLRGVYFAIFTLAISEMVWIFFSRWALTRGEDGFTLGRVPAWIDAAQSRINLYYIGLALFIVAFVFIRRLVNSPTGAVFKAIRENEERARAIGYNTLRFKLLSITAAGMLAGAAGILFSLLEKKIGPELLAVGHTVDALLTTIIGGAGTFIGPVLGATGLELADTLFRNSRLTIGDLVIDISTSWQLILGLIFVLVVLVFPFGIVGTWARLRAYLQSRRQPAAVAPTARDTAKV